MTPSKSTSTAFSALILASGLSERMGKPKPLLMWDQSMTFLEKIISEYIQAGSIRVIVTVNSRVLPHCKLLEKFPKVQCIYNKHPDWGRMYSLKLGLEELKESSYCFIQNVDNPHIDSAIIKKIVQHADPESWCSPEYKGVGGHPVLLPNSIINQILQEKRVNITLKDMLGRFPQKRVPMDNNSILKNINTPQDYLMFLEDQRNLSKI